MRDFAQEIRPGVGLGELILGMKEDAVRALLGEPMEISEEDDGTGEITRYWNYPTLQLRLAFDEDDEFRLGTITTEFEWATLFGQKIIGLTDEEFVKCRYGDLGQAQLDEDWGDSKDYLWPDVNLSCWVSDGFIDSVSLQPLFDDSGDIPLWP